MRDTKRHTLSLTSSATTLHAQHRGFTLIELMVVVAIIGLLALIGVSSYQNYLVRAQLSESAVLLGKFARDFEAWRQVHGRYPNDSHIVLPPDAPDLTVNQAQWATSTGLGGNWNWEGPDNYSYAGISIVGATAPEEDILQFDAIVDDGVLSSGRFRRTANGRLTFILDE